MAERKDDPAEMARMRSWIRDAANTLGIPPEAYEPQEAPLLSLTRTVAHGPSRPGAPLTTYLAGFAAGRGADAAEVIEELEKLAESYQDDETDR